MKANIGLSDRNRDAVVGILNALLADEYVLYTKTRNYHWNVVGPEFGELHRFFQDQYEELDGFVDEIAERARTLGGWATGTLSEFLKAARLIEHPGDHPQAREMLAALLTDHESMIQRLRSDAEACMDKYRDAGTNDFLTGLLEKHEKMGWMLRAHLEASGA